MRSIRRRLAGTLFAGFAALLGAAGLFVERGVRERAVEEFDASLEAEARGLMGITSLAARGVEFDYAPEAMPHFERPHRPDYFQIALEDGTVLRRSTHLRGELPRAGAETGRPAARDVRLPDGRAGRLLEVRFAPKSDDADGVPEAAPARAARGPELLLAVARGRERLDAHLARTRAALLGAGGIAGGAAAVLVWFALRAGLRPLDEIAARVRGVGAENLAARIALEDAPAELRPVVDQLDALLARLEASFERERRFAGYVAHELRTPIAELRSLADVAGRWPDDPEATARFFADVHDVAGRMERVVADLLLLARCHAGVETVRRGRVRVRDVVETSWARVAPRRPPRPLEIEVGDDLVVETDPDKLSLLVTNLLDNALSHAAPGGPVRCAAAAHDGRFVLDVSNPAESLGAADLARVAEPFWRRDAARSGDGHAGLGLSLVTALARLLGFEAGIAQEADGTFRVRLSGPMRAAPLAAKEAP